MGTYHSWNVASGNFGAASSWTPLTAPTSADDTSIFMTASIYGSGQASTLNIGAAVTISAALSTTITAWTLVGVHGVGSLTVNAAWNDNNGTGSNLVIGQDTGGSGGLTVNAGGSINVAYLTIGADYSVGSTGAVGVAVIQGGGGVVTTGGWDNVGVNSFGASSLTVTGAGSSWTSSGGLQVGNSGSGTLTVANKASLSAVNLNIGVDWDNNTVVGGTGTALFESGATITTTGQWQEIGSGGGGATQAATGSVTVDGAGTKWLVNNGAIEIGDVGSKSGSLTISNGGNVTATAEFDVGTENNGTNVDTHDGSYGTLLIESGGTAVTGGYYVASNGLSWDSVGAISATDAHSTATVTGAGSSWKMTAILQIYASGSVNVASGGMIESSEGLDLRGGTLTVDSSSTYEVGNLGGAALGFLTIDASSGNPHSWGYGTINAAIVDNQGLYAQDGGTLTINGANGGFGTIAGTGSLYIGAEADLSLNAAVASTLQAKFIGWDGVLDLKAPASFAATINNFNEGDKIDLEGLAFAGTPTSYIYTPGVAGAKGTLKITEGSSSITLNIGSSPQTISGELTLSQDASGTGTLVSFTNGAAYAPFQIWSTLGNFFTSAGGGVDGKLWANGVASDGGTPVWVETETPAAGYAPGVAENYTIMATAQDWVGDIQTATPLLTENIVDPFTADGAFGNLAGSVGFSSTSTTGSGALLYWTASTTPGDYAVQFQSATVTFPTAPTNNSLLATQGSPVTLISAIASPTSWTYSSQTSTSFVFAYTTTAAAGTENLYFQAFSNTGVATTSSPTLIATLPNGTPYYIGYSNGSYGYRYLSLTGASGAGLYGGTYNTSTGALGATSELLALPSYTAFDGISSYALSTGDSLRFVEGVANGQDVIQTFLNKSTAQATFNLSSASDYFQTASVYDINADSLDYTVLAYTDNSVVHLELIDENGKQLGGDFVVAGLTSFDRIHLLQGSSTGASTRIELSYTVADPNGGNEIKGIILDTTSIADAYTFGGTGLYDGTPFNDTITDAPGTYYVDGGGGADTFVVAYGSSQVTLSIDAVGHVIVTTPGGTTTLARFTTITLNDATVTIAGNVLTQTNSDNSKVTSRFNITGQGFTSTIRSLDRDGNLIAVGHGGVTGTPYHAYTTLYSGPGTTGNIVSGNELFYANQASGLTEVDLDGGGNLSRALYAYATIAPGTQTGFEADYVAGQLAGGVATYLAPAGAAYSTFAVEYDNNYQYVGAVYTFAYTGQTYDEAQYSYTAAAQPKLTEATFSQYTGSGGPNVASFFYDNNGASTGVQYSYTGITGQAYTSDILLYNASNVLIAVERGGYTTKPFSSQTTFYNASGVAQEIVRDYTSPTSAGSINGQAYNAFETILNPAFTLLATAYHLDNGANVYVGAASNVSSPTFGGTGVSANTAELSNTLTGGDWTITGGGTGETFNFAAFVNKAEITDYGAAFNSATDVVSVSTQDFANWTTMLADAAPSGAGANTTFTSMTTGDKLTLDGVTLSQLTALSTNQANNDFLFHA